MNIVVIGSNGYVGRNLIENLKTIRDGKNRTRVQLKIDSIFEYNENTSSIELENWCRQADIVFDLTEFHGNHPYDKDRLIPVLKRNINCSVVKCSPYYSKTVSLDETKNFIENNNTLIYKLPCVVGKWEEPDEYSLIGSLCTAAAHDKPYSIKDDNKIIEVLFVDDFVNEMLDALEGHPHRCDFPEAGSYSSDPTAQWDGFTPQPSEYGKYCYCPVTHRVTVGQVIRHLESFKALNSSFLIPEIPTGSFVYKLYSMYLSFIPEEKMCYQLKMNEDERGVFTELLKTKNNGQVSINIARPGNVRGQHWHNSKWEVFIVVSGHALIQERRIGINPQTGKEYEIREFDVRGEDMKAVIMLPGFAHNIINLEQDKDLVTVMWANESFDYNHPDTFREIV